jgi:hypothetical protein
LDTPSIADIDLAARYKHPDFRHVIFNLQLQKTESDHVWLLEPDMYANSLDIFDFLYEKTFETDGVYSFKPLNGFSTDTSDNFRLTPFLNILAMDVKSINTDAIDFGRLYTGKRSRELSRVDGSQYVPPFPLTDNDWTHLSVNLNKNTYELDD